MKRITIKQFMEAAEDILNKSGDGQWGAAVIGKLFDVLVEEA